MSAHQIIKQIYDTKSVVGCDGQIHGLHSEIDEEEGQFLFDIVSNEPGILQTLEVGCAYGLSSLHICAALQNRPGVSHTIIDPFQDTQWDGVGKCNLEAAGIEFFHLIEAKSEFALPNLLEDMENKFDFVFIDGWHTFDHTMLDCFYATRLLRVGGYLVIDDLWLPSVRRATDFFKNCPCYEEFGCVSKTVRRSRKQKILSRLLFPFRDRPLRSLLSKSVLNKLFEEKTVRMVALRKIEEDKRNWDWHYDSF